MKQFVPTVQFLLTQ